jgi:hypothetical protein
LCSVFLFYFAFNFLTIYDKLVADPRNGDTVCTSCGAVVADRAISDEADWRVFTDDSDSQSKVRVGAAYNPLQAYSLTERNAMERDVSEKKEDHAFRFDEPMETTICVCVSLLFRLVMFVSYKCPRTNFISLNLAS